MGISKSSTIVKIKSKIRFLSFYDRGDFSKSGISKISKILYACFLLPGVFVFWMFCLGFSGFVWEYWNSLGFVWVLLKHAYFLGIFCPVDSFR